ncbi:MAG: 50S ribosomal protein L11 methyltransferase, partial [Terriglobales bacterium]
MYSIYQYGRMIADQVRTGSYSRALQRAVKPGCTVLDIGTGSGILALLACQAGARRVYAVEHDDVIHLARQVASANGLADRIDFIQARSTQISLPEPVDVVVSDLHGTLPLCFTSLQSLIDARRRLLAPGGVMIPQCESLRVAILEAPALYQEHLAPWRMDGLGVDLESVQRVVVNDWYKARVLPQQLLVEPQSWTHLDYSLLESPNVEGQARWTLERPGTAHGFAVWFDTVLFQDIAFSNAPGQE